jgi:hypothetical protein
MAYALGNTAASAFHDDDDARDLAGPGEDVNRGAVRRGNDTEAPEF